MKSGFKALLVLATLAAGYILPASAHAQTDSLCLQYPMFVIQNMYLYYVVEYQPTCDDDGYSGDGYYWETWYDNCPQSCEYGNCLNFSPANLIGEKSPRGKDLRFPELLPSSYRLGTKKDGAAMDPVGAFSSPTAGIDAQSQGFVFVTTASGNTIPIKLFTVTFDFKAAGVPAEKYPKGNQRKTIFVGIEVENDGGATPAAGLQVTQLPFKNYSGKIDVKSTETGAIRTFNILTSTRLN